MGMQKIRADKSLTQPDGAICWYAEWIGGPSLSKIEDCRLAQIEGEMRRTVYIIDEPDTWFSQPATCRIAGREVRGYVTSGDDGNLVFHQCYY